eukprot:scaffold21134_cov85-Cyclotella_meneghiniana.AAC.3
MEPDTSSFPLLRIDQLPIHTTGTLEEAQRQLIQLEGSEDEITSIAPFVSKLLHCIENELNSRTSNQASIALDRRGSKQTSNMSCRLTPQKKTNTGRRRVSSIKKLSPKKLNPCNAPPARQSTKQPPSLSFFVPNSPESNVTSFRSRSKQANASIQARSQDALDKEREELRQHRKKEALEKMQVWRMGRELSKKQREKLLEEERKVLHLRRMERLKREDRLKISMQSAADAAKQKSLQSGSSPEEAILDAAAAAAKVVDDQSTVFHASDDGDSDVDSADFDLYDDIDDDSKTIALPTDVLENSFGEKNDVPLGSNDDVCDEVISHVEKVNDDFLLHSTLDSDDDKIYEEVVLQHDDASVGESEATATDDKPNHDDINALLPTTDTYAEAREQANTERLEHTVDLEEDSSSQSPMTQTFVEPTTSLENAEPEHSDPSLPVDPEVTHTPSHLRPRHNNKFNKAFPLPISSTYWFSKRLVDSVRPVD